jgi:Spermine/spermidine synthase domain
MIAPRSVIAAMFSTTLVTLAMQVCVSRILSVTQSYHYAFLIVALAMLGMAASAITVFVESKRTDGKELGPARSLQIGAVLLTVGTFGFAFAGYRVVVAVAEAGLASAFYFCGYVVAWALTRYARDIARLYLFDLLGAAAGCLLAVVLLDRTSPLNVLLLCALALALAGMLMARATGAPQPRAIAIAALLACVTCAAFISSNVTRLRFAKFSDQSDVIWERWNGLARVTVRPFTADPSHPAGVAYWGISDRYTRPLPEILWLELDAGAGTPLIRGGGAPGADLEILRWDVTSTAYWLREGHQPNVFIIGGGAGRDILTALTFGARNVDVVEINPAVIAASRDAFGDYGGHVYDLPHVNLAIGNARRELARRSDRYDIIQMSMIDTWAASMSGQLVLTENTLYTREAYDLFLSHLEDDGMLAISRWYDKRDYGEVARVLALMGDVLERHGAKQPSDHIAVLYTKGRVPYGPVASCLMKRSPFTQAEIDTLAAFSRRMDFKLLWPAVGDLAVHDALDPKKTIDREPGELAASQFDLAPPTDERPFFFNTRKMGQSWALAIKDGDIDRITTSSGLLVIVLVMLLVLGFRFLIWPLRGHDGLTLRALVSTYRGPAAYFMGIGMGFMLIELALIQRFMVFLGHPAYGLSVVLFSLLLFTAVGSWLSARLRGTLEAAVRWPIAGVIALTLANAFFVPIVLHAAEAVDQPVRLALVIALIAPLAVCLGMIFPTGVRMLSARRWHAGPHETSGASDEGMLDAKGAAAIVPWMWGVNGFAAVVASVVGMMVAMAWGYTAVLLLAIASYAVTLASTFARPALDPR